jgi:hypothetical protein
LGSVRRGIDCGCAALTVRVAEVSRRVSNEPPAIRRNEKATASRG